MSITASGIGFIGRKKELKHLRECLKKGQNVAIIAPRRYGKSSLINQALNQMNAENYPRTTINLINTPTADLLSSVLTKEVLKNLKLHKTFTRFRKGESFTDSNTYLHGILEEFPFLTGFVDPLKDEWDLLAESLDFPEAISKKHKKGMICVYEEMGNIQRMDQGARIAALLNATLQNHSQTSYIFSACHLSEIQEITGSGRSSLLKKENIIQLDLLNNQELIASLNKKFSRLKLKLPRHYLNDLVKLTKAHPYYTQLAIRQTILSYVLEGNIPRYKVLSDQLLRLEKDYLELTWEAISRNREYVQILLALPFGSSNIYPRLKSKGINVARAQKKLEEMGLLVKNEQAGYTIADPLLELWIQKKF